MFLIVGHSGFLGSHLLAKYPNSYAINSHGLFINNKPSDLSLSDLFGKNRISAVIYCAVKYTSFSYELMQYVNCDYPYLLLTLCKSNCIPFIYFGSFFEKQPGSYMKEYIDTKLKFFSLMNNLSHNQSFYLRLEHIYGLNDKDAKFIPCIIKRIKNGEDIILNHPNHIRDFTPVEFVVEITSRFLSGELYDSYFEVGTRRPQTSLSFIKSMLQNYTNYYGLDKSTSQISILPKSSSVIHSSCARYHNIFDSYPPSYFRRLEQFTIEQILIA